MRDADVDHGHTGLTAQAQIRACALTCVFEARFHCDLEAGGASERRERVHHVVVTSGADRAAQHRAALEVIGIGGRA